MDTEAAPAQRGVPPTQINGATDLQQADHTVRTADTTGRGPAGLLQKAINGIRMEAEENKNSSPGTTGGDQREPAVEVPHPATSPPESKASEPEVRSHARDSLQLTESHLCWSVIMWASRSTL